MGKTHIWQYCIMYLMINKTSQKESRPIQNTRFDLLLEQGHKQLEALFAKYTREIDMLIQQSQARFERVEHRLDVLEA
jgi:hypothetical protein